MNAPIAAANLAPEVAQRAVPEAFLTALKARFGNNCSTALVVLASPVDCRPITTAMLSLVTAWTAILASAGTLAARIIWR